MIEATHAALRDHRKVILVAPCGSGKRICAVWWANEIAKRGRTALIVTNRRILIYQMLEELGSEHVRSGVIMASEAQKRLAPIQVASLQTLQRRGFDELPPADWVIVDECHCSPSTYEKLFKKYPDSKIVGLTATPLGPKDTSLLWLYDKVVETVTNSKLIEDGWLLSTELWAPSEPDIRGVTISGGDFNQKQLEKAIEECTVFADVFEYWEKYSHMQTITFSPRVKYAEGMTERFRLRGYRAETITGTTSKRDRESIVAAYESGDVQVLNSVNVISIGFDAPIAQCAIDLQPTKSITNFWQRCGRVKRKSPGQDISIWLDFAGNYYRFLHPDASPPWMAFDDSFKESKGTKKDPKPKTGCRNCGYIPTPLEPTYVRCPKCGTRFGKPIRKIRMRDGRMIHVPLEKKKRPPPTSDQKAWDSAVRIAAAKGGGMNQARAIYKSTTGKWPNGLANCPESKDSWLWKVSAKDFLMYKGKRS